MTHNTQGGIALSEEYLKECLNRVYSADPTGYDVVIKDLNQRMNKLVKYIRKLQSPLPASPDGTELKEKFFKWRTDWYSKNRTIPNHKDYLKFFDTLFQPLQQENERLKNVQWLLDDRQKLHGEMRMLKQENEMLKGEIPELKKRADDWEAGLEKDIDWLTRKLNGFEQENIELRTQLAEAREALRKLPPLFERFMPKNVATDNPKDMAMYEAFHTVTSALK